MSDFTIDPNAYNPPTTSFQMPAGATGAASPYGDLSGAQAAFPNAGTAASPYGDLSGAQAAFPNAGTAASPYGDLSGAQNAFPGAAARTPDNPMGMGDPTKAPPKDDAKDDGKPKDGCTTCKGKKDEEKKPRKLGTYATVTKSFGVMSLSTSTYTDNAGNQFMTTTRSWGPSMPGWGMSEGNVYAWENAPADTSIRDVALGPSWSGGFFDNTAMNSSGYTLELVGTPNIGLERGVTTEIPGTATGK
jgi:hypothetical protein